MSSSISRPLRALRPKRVQALYAQRHASDVASSSSCSSSSSTNSNSPPPSVPSPSSPHLLPTSGLRPSLRLPVHHPNPRSPDFPSRFPDPPVHKHINFPNKLFQAVPPSERPATLGGNDAAKREMVLASTIGMSVGEIRGLRRYAAVRKRVTHMSKKGKQRSVLAYTVVGSPERGLVGVGRGRGDEVPQASDQAFHEACMNMDFVNKYEGRTIWGQGSEVSAKWGATKVFMRARPAGFGLMVPHSIHAILTACGIRDCSATIEGSRTPISVMHCVLQILHGGANPPGFGTGVVGQRGRRSNKGAGMRSREEVERERGRYGVDIGRRV